MGPNEALVRRWFEEVWNERREAAIDALFAADGVGHGLGEPLRGPAGFKPFWRGLLAAFDDVKITVDGVVEAGDTVALRATARLRRAGRDHLLPGLVYTRVRGGKILESWNSWDCLGLLTELGHCPRDAMARLLAR